jgi:hypothetical protein
LWTFVKEYVTFPGIVATGTVRVKISSFAVELGLIVKPARPDCVVSVDAPKVKPAGAVHGWPGKGSLEHICKRIELIIPAD